MPRYVDGFVIPLPKNKVEDYRAMATKAAAVWKKCGAIGFTECVGDDFSNEECLSFPAGIGAKEDETVMFSWILFESKESRDKVNAKVMEDPDIKHMCESGNMPFDPKRMLYSGFQVIVDA